MINLLILANWKNNSYNSILVIVNWLTKIVTYKPLNITINTAGLARVIINVIVYHYCVFQSIVMDQGLLFPLKF